MPQQPVAAKHPPFGVKPEARRTAIRLPITTKGNCEKLFADLSPDATEFLRDQLTEAHGRSE
jgi:hypothetical protein